MSKTDYLRQEHHEFMEASAEALANGKLQIILGRLGDTLGAKNKQAWSELVDSDLIRERARSIKDATLADLATHLETLEQSVLRLGGRVHWADDGEEARRAILDIIQSSGGKKVVKSKSMTSE